jgi:ABC-type oligopeptide transport system substrate-binding subunit
MVPVLLALDSLIWYYVWKNYKSDRSKGPYPENPQFDYDLDQLWLANWIEQPDLPQQDKFEDIAIKQAFEAELDLEEELEDISRPADIVWCNGTPLVPNYEADMRRFLRIKSQAYQDGEYNSKLMEDGGEDELYIAWFMLKGYPRYGAERLLHAGYKPWDDLDGI